MLTPMRWPQLSSDDAWHAALPFMDAYLAHFDFSGVSITQVGTRSSTWACFEGWHSLHGKGTVPPRVSLPRIRCLLTCSRMCVRATV